ncbi:GtrA family protein [Saxibacter everestensis]|uniref:GtrA family protein n=1 Tax=Saxibacter everestensis TaxID=2909229 RepID=A0ABY8QQT0_9MICO|nr:GtrA family protein [Brevibacteriaceae bacterium ZFBP1038]
MASRRWADLGWLALVSHLSKFGAVGTIAFLVDLGVYNALRFSILDDKPIGAKVISVMVATVVSWLGSRYWTFREGRGNSVLRELFSFALINAGGLVIAAACLFVSHYGLGYTSKLADNISGNGIGLFLGTAFRYAMYRLVLFRPPKADIPSTEREHSSA